MANVQRYDAMLLASLVEVVRTVHPLPWEAFVALRMDYAGLKIYHPRAIPIAIRSMEDLEDLANRGLIDLRRLPSGAQTFSVTPAGIASLSSAESGDAADEHLQFNVGPT